LEIERVMTTGTPAVMSAGEAVSDFKISPPSAFTSKVAARFPIFTV